MKKLLMLCFSLISFSLFAQEVEKRNNLTTVEKQPIYPGCEDSLSREENTLCFQKGIMKHITSNFNYPSEAQDLGISERIFVNFDINPEGMVENAKVLRGNNIHLRKEALRLINLIPKMIPAQQDGEAVSVSFTIPISFKTALISAPNFEPVLSEKKRND